MEQFSPTDLKAILHSKRANIYYLEMCRVMQKDGRVLYLAEDKKSNAYWNIPIANTTCILLGTGTSITQAAMRMLASAGVLVGFCGGGGTPLLMGCEIEWMTPQSEYRPTEYIQGWLSFWFDEKKRLIIAKRLQKRRIEYISAVWKKDKDLITEGFSSGDIDVEKGLSIYSKKIDKALNVGELLQAEAQLTKELYKYAANKTSVADFVREREATDKANIFLNHGNYLAYGLAATATWVLGISHGFAVMHGKTRRGALVFDIADLVKDAIVLPWAFICARENMAEQDFRQQLLQKFTQFKSLDFMFDNIKEMALNMDWETNSL